MFGALVQAVKRERPKADCNGYFLGKNVQGAQVPGIAGVHLAEGILRIWTSRIHEGLAI